MTVNGEDALQPYNVYVRMLWKCVALSLAYISHVHSHKLYCLS